MSQNERICDQFNARATVQTLEYEDRFVVELFGILCSFSDNIAVTEPPHLYSLYDKQ